MKNINFTEDICADGICCFMSIPKSQNHLGIARFFFKRGNTSHGIKLLCTAHEMKDILYLPCRCLNFYIEEDDVQGERKLRVVVRCGIFHKKYRPYTCRAFPDREDSFMHDLLAPCIYNEYRAHENYVKLKHKHFFRLFYAIKDNRKVLEKIFPGRTSEEAREKLNQCNEVVKVSAFWNEKKPSEYFLFEVPKTDTVLYTSHIHPKITSIKQAYDCWQGHIESWLERHYGSKWQCYLDRAVEQEGSKF
ncbi:MAG: hypothetical protein ACUBOA_00100 [Candidatus Loosdrechtia sp.]|uniref:hypothetical protein n=1 Tax=Candidatus Loosdrechtia sp. TaxID=3101272 RepID=UPI003A772637|nr:MAG: hypothetical protein QY305_03710 [Candidatus Jettenia sp. AMX2]